MFLRLVTSERYCSNLVLSGLGPSSALGEKEKKIGVGEKKNRRAKRTEKYSGEGKGWHRSPIFFLSRPRFLAFSPTAETGPRLSIKTVITG